LSQFEDNEIHLVRSQLQSAEAILRRGEKIVGRNLSLVIRDVSDVGHTWCD